MKKAMTKKKTAWKHVKASDKKCRASSLKVAAADFERPVIYRGIKIDPIAGKRSSLARAIRDDLRKQSEQSRRKSA
jgi:hypothetical protein